jgi:hypothetical protein
MSVRLPARIEQLCFHWTDLRDIWYLSIFRKSVEKIQVSLKSDEDYGLFTWGPMFICDSLTVFFLKWEMFQAEL